MNIFVADDDPDIADILVYVLQREGHAVTLARDGGAASRMLAEREFDMAILDIGLPRVDGYQLCRQIRARSDTPIILLTARDREQDKVVGLDLGADDYVTKPFSHKELLARVRAVARRRGVASPAAARSGVVHLGGAEGEPEAWELEIDQAQHLATWSGRTLGLTPLEYKLLLCLALNAGRIVPRGQLISFGWGSSHRGDDDMLKVHVRHLRQKLAGPESDDQPAASAEERGPIQTVRGVGYKLDLQPAKP